MSLEDVLQIFKEYNIDETKSCYGYMDTNPIDGTFKSFCFDGEKYYKESTNPDRPCLESTYKIYYENERDFLIHWLRNRYCFFINKDIETACIFKSLLDEVRNNEKDS